MSQHSTAPKSPRILIIDNYDSFTYNLVHYLEELGAGTHGRCFICPGGKHPNAG